MKAIDGKNIIKALSYTLVFDSVIALFLTFMRFGGVGIPGTVYQLFPFLAFFPVFAALNLLEDYIHTENEVDPLIKLALIHYQFEAIHPFTDGNGRTGRILNILYLIQKHLLDLPVLYLSKYIIEQKSDYYRLLRGVTELQAWEPWILYMLDAIEVTALYTRDKILAIRNLLAETIEFTKKHLPSRAYSKDLIELLFRQPYTKANFLVDEGIAERKTASNYLKQLEKIGILRVQKVGKENLYLNKELFEVLSK